MTRDYKPSQSRSKPAGKNNAFLTGLLLGVILGIGVSIGVAVMVTGGVAFLCSTNGLLPPDAQNSLSSNKPDDNAVPDQNGETKPAANRFDFYKILPGESQVTEQEIQKGKDAQKAETQAGNENYFLQVGAFQTEQEADNMKAKLALLGMEAIVQTATVPDKGVWHRVRVGPFNDLDQISKARAELTKNGFNTDLIKIHSNVPDQ